MVGFTERFACGGLGNSMKKDTLKVLYVPSLNMGVYYWRIENYANTMVGFDNVAVNVKMFYDPSQNIAWDKVCASQSDDGKMIRETMESAFGFFNIIVFQKVQNIEGLQLISEMKAKYPDVIIIMECDDSIGEITPSNLYFHQVGLEHNMAARHALLSNAIIVSTEYLKKSVQIIVGPEKPIHVAPNCIDYTSWKVDEHPLGSKSKKRVVYVGAAGHDDDLFIAYQAMLPLLDTVEFVVRYGGFRPEWLSDSRVDFKIVDWSIPVYPQKLYDLNADLALAPLEDTEFNRCKSNLKWLEWSSIGVPIVCSEIEPFVRMKGGRYMSGNDPEEFRREIEYALKDIDDEKRKDIRKDNRRYYDIKSKTGELLTFMRGLR